MRFPYNTPASRDRPGANGRRKMTNQGWKANGKWFTRTDSLRMGRPISKFFINGKPVTSAAWHFEYAKAKAADTARA